MTNAALHIDRLEVIYDSGSREQLNVRSDISQGGESRAIGLQGGKGRLKRVDFWYKTKGLFKGKAEVILFGMK